MAWPWHGGVMRRRPKQLGRELAGGARASSCTDLASWRSCEARLHSGMVGVVVKRPEQRCLGWGRRAIRTAFVSNLTAFYAVSGPDLLGWWMSSVKDTSSIIMLAGIDENGSET